MTHSWSILFNVMLTTFLAVFSGTISIIGNQTIQGDLALSNSLIIWITILYLLGSNTMVPAATRLAEMFGYRRMYILGILLFTLSSGLAGSANNFFSLALARYIEGLGAGLIFPLGMSLIAQNFPKERLPFALSLYLAVSFGVGLGLGMPLSGYFNQFLSWRTPFYLMVPGGLFATLLSFLFPETPRKQDLKFDFGGFFFFTLFISSFLIATSSGQLSSTNEGWRSPWIIGCFILAALSLTITIRIESRHPQPLIPLSLFKDPLFSLSCVSLFLLGMAIFASLTLSSSYLIVGLKTEKWMAGLICLPYGVTVACSGILAGLLMKKIPVSLLTLFGLALLIASYFWNNILSWQTGWRDLIPILILRGVGLGFALGPTTAQALSHVPKALSDPAATMLTFFRQVGATFSTTLIIIFSIRRKIFHGARYGEQINDQLPAYKATLMKLQGLSTADPYSTLAEQAKFLIVGNVETQAYIQALNDTVLIFGYITIVIACLLAILDFWQWFKRSSHESRSI